MPKTKDLTLILLLFLVLRPSSSAKIEVDETLELYYHPLESDTFDYDDLAELHDEQESPEPSNRSDDQSPSNQASNDSEDDEETFVPEICMKLSKNEGEIRLTFYYKVPDERWFTVDVEEPTPSVLFRYANEQIPLTFLDIYINPHHMKGLPSGLFDVFNPIVEDGESEIYVQENMVQMLNQVEWTQEEFDSFLKRSTKIMATNIINNEDAKDEESNPAHDDRVEKKLYNTMFENQNVLGEINDTFSFAETHEYEEVLSTVLTEKLEEVKNLILEADQKKYDESIDQVLIDFIEEAGTDDYYGEYETEPVHTAEQLFEFYFGFYTKQDERLEYVISLPFYIGIFAEEVERGLTHNVDFETYSNMVDVETQEKAIRSVSTAMRDIITEYLEFQLPDYELRSGLVEKLELLEGKLKPFYIVENAEDKPEYLQLNSELDELLDHLDNLKATDPFIAKNEKLWVDNIEVYVTEFMKQGDLKFENMKTLFYNWMRMGNQPSQVSTAGFEYNPLRLDSRRLVLV